MNILYNKPIKRITILLQENNNYCLILLFCIISHSIFPPLYKRKTFMMTYLVKYCFFATTQQLHNSHESSTCLKARFYEVLNINS